MLNGIVLLLGSDKTATRAGYVQALSLLFTAFIALGLDAYLFGMVTGDTTAVIRSVIPHVSACRRAWTEAMLAAGLLGVGTVAIVAGFVFLFAVYFGDQRRSRYYHHAQLASSLDLLVLLCNAVRAGVTLVVGALLYMTARSYLQAIYNGKIPAVAKPCLHIYVGFGVVAVLVFTVALFAPLLPRRERRNVLTRLVQPDTDKRFIQTLKIAIYSSIGYSVATVIAAVAVASTSAYRWTASPYVDHIAIATVLWILLGPLVPVLLLTGRAVPSFETPGPSTRSRTSRRPAKRPLAANSVPGAEPPAAQSPAAEPWPG